MPLSLANLHGVLHVSQLRKYVLDPSHVIQMDDVHVKGNLTIEALALRIEGLKVKQLRGKDIALLKVLCSGPTGESWTWEHNYHMRESYPTLFLSGNF